MYNLGLMQLSIGVLIVWCFSCVHAQRAHTPPPPHCTSLKQVVNKLSGPDARLFQRCYTLLQNSLNRTTDDNGHTTQLPASSVPAVLSGALKSMNAVRCVVAHTHMASSTRVFTCSSSPFQVRQKPKGSTKRSKRRNLSINVNAGAVVPDATPPAAAVVQHAPPMFVPETPRRRLHTQLLLRLLSQAQSEPGAVAAVVGAPPPAPAQPAPSGGAAPPPPPPPPPSKRKGPGAGGARAKRGRPQSPQHAAPTVVKRRRKKPGATPNS